MKRLQLIQPQLVNDLQQLLTNHLYAWYVSIEDDEKVRIMTPGVTLDDADDMEIPINPATNKDLGANLTKSASRIQTLQLQAHTLSSRLQTWISGLGQLSQTLLHACHTTGTVIPELQLLFRLLLGQEEAVHECAHGSYSRYMMCMLLYRHAPPLSKADLLYLLEQTLSKFNRYCILHMYMYVCICICTCILYSLYVYMLALKMRWP